MPQKETIRKLADRLLKNSGVTNSTGLYDGKAGLSLALFLAAGYLQDEQLEDTAYNLLQESLVVKNSNMCFENGLPGIGYALLYLVENKYLEADFDEIFGEQYEAIIKSYENIEKAPMALVKSLQTIYFLSKAGNVKKEDKRISKIIKKIFEGLELYLTVQFFDFTDIRYINNKAEVLNIYTIYLKLIDYSGYHRFSHALLEDYAALYRQGKIASSLETGFYLSRLTNGDNIKGYEDVINENINNGINNICLETLSLRERIDCTKIIRNIKNKNVKDIDLLSDVENIYQDSVIQDLLTKVDEKSFPFGYGAGLGRLLIYCINSQMELL